MLDGRGIGAIFRKCALRGLRSRVAGRLKSTDALDAAADRMSSFTFSPSEPSIRRGSSFAKA
jgi:hypothetical protein